METMTHDTSKLAAYLSGFNATTIDREDDPSADEDGHVITGTMIHRPGDSESSIVPVRVRVGHGVGAATAASMLRKMADMIEDQPGFLSDKPGAAIRRLNDGTSVKKQLTIAAMLEVAEQMSDEERTKFHAMIDQIRVQIDDHETGTDHGSPE